MGHATNMNRRLGDKGVVLRLAIVGGLLLTLLPAPRSTASTGSNLAESIRAQRARLEAAPRDVAVMNDLANLLVLAGDVEEAEEVYRRALEVEPERVATIYNLALLHAETGRIRPARRGFQKALEIAPGHAWSHYHLGTLNAAAGKRNKAIGHYVQAFRLDPRLTRPEFNPHIIDNELVIDALLRAHEDKAAATPVPKIYQDPEHVRRLLLPPQPAPEPPAEGPESAGPSGGERIREVPEAAPRHVGEPPAPAAPGQTSVPEAREPDRRELETEGVEPPPLPAAPRPPASAAPSRPESTAPPRPEPAAPPRPQPMAQPRPEPIAPPPPVVREPTPVAPEPAPVFGSVGRLELRLVPKPPDRLIRGRGGPWPRQGPCCRPCSWPC